jgi:hypothetical protein
MGGMYVGINTEGKRDIFVSGPRVDKRRVKELEKNLRELAADDMTIGLVGELIEKNEALIQLSDAVCAGVTNIYLQDHPEAIDWIAREYLKKHPKLGGIGGKMSPDDRKAIAVEYLLSNPGLVIEVAQQSPTMASQITSDYIAKQLKLGLD